MIWKCAAVWFWCRKGKEHFKSEMSQMRRWILMLLLTLMTEQVNCFFSLPISKSLVFSFHPEIVISSVLLGKTLLNVWWLSSAHFRHVHTCVHLHAFPACTHWAGNVLYCLRYGLVFSLCGIDTLNCGDHHGSNLTGFLYSGPFPPSYLCTFTINKNTINDTVCVCNWQMTWMNNYYYYYSYKTKMNYKCHFSVIPPWIKSSFG